MRNYLRQSAAWVTALRDRPFKSARFQLTALYTLNAFFVLALFIGLLTHLWSIYLHEDLAGQLPNAASARAITNQLFLDLQQSAFLLGFFALMALGVLSYFSVRLT